MVDSPAGVAQVAQIQKAQAISAETAAGKDGYQVVSGVPVERLPEYRVGAGDVLEIVYHIQYKKDQGDYKIEVKVQVNIRIGRSSTPRSWCVPTDAFPCRWWRRRRQPFPPAAEPPNSAGAMRNTSSTPTWRSPYRNSTPRSTSLKRPSLPRRAAEQGRAHRRTARFPLPIIGTMQAAGLTVRELEKMINGRYSEYVRDLQATLIVNEIHHMKFYVLGEVAQPGVFEMAERPTLLQAIARAGGYTSRACLSDVVVMRSEGLEKPMVSQGDLDKTLASGVMYPGLTVQPADIIYVPKSALRKTRTILSKRSSPREFTASFRSPVPLPSTMI